MILGAIMDVVRSCPYVTMIVLLLLLNVLFLLSLLLLLSLI